MGLVLARCIVVNLHNRAEKLALLRNQKNKINVFHTASSFHPFLKEKKIKYREMKIGI